MAKWVARNGVEITSERLEKLVAEAEAGFEFDQASLIRVGRPSLGDAGPSKRLQVRVERELDEALIKLAKTQQCSISEVARDALREYVARRGGSV